MTTALVLHPVYALGERVVDNPDPVAAEDAFGGPVRRCRTCGDHFPADAEFYYRWVDGPDGLNPDCKVCYRYYKRRREEIQKGMARRRARR